MRVLLALLSLAVGTGLANDQQGATLTGVVTTFDGKQVVGASINVRWTGYNGRSLLRAGGSGTAGDFQFPGLGLGKLKISVYCLSTGLLQNGRVNCIPRGTGEALWGGINPDLLISANGTVEQPLQVEKKLRASFQAGPVVIRLARLQLPGAPATGGTKLPVELKLSPAKGVTVTTYRGAGNQPEGKLSQASDGSILLDSPAEDLVLDVDAPGHESRRFLLIAGASPALFDETGQPVQLLDVARDSGQRLRAGVVQLMPISKTPDEAVIRYIPSYEMSHRYSWIAGSLLQLPLRDSRTPDALALLVPGVAPAPETRGSAGPGLSAGVGSAGEFSMNGIRSRDNNFTSDGSDNNDEEVGARRAGFVALFPQVPENLAEFQVIPILADARYGRSVGGQIDGFSRPGGTAWHGQAFAFLNWSGLNSRGYFDRDISAYPASLRQQLPVTADGTLGGPPVAFSGTAPKGLTVRNGALFQLNPLAQPPKATRSLGGFALGGPVGPAGTAVFASYERLGADAQVQRQFIVPTANQRALSGRPANLLPATVPGDAIFSLYPFPNNPLGPFGPNTYTETKPEDSSGTLYSLRFDHNRKLIRIADTFTIRYNGTLENSTLASTGAALSSALRPVLRTHNVAMYWNTTLTSALANTFRMSFGQTAAHFDDAPDSRLLPSSLFPSTPFLLNAPLLYNISGEQGTAFSSIAPAQATADLPDAEHSTGPLGRVELPGYSPIGVDVYHFPQTRRHSTWQWADTVTIATRGHVISTGFDIRRVRLRSNLERNARPVAVFGGLFAEGSNQAWLPASMAAAGIPTNLFQALTVAPDPGLRLRSSQADFFISDLIRLHSRLHLTVGGRINLHRLPKDPDERLRAAFDLDRLKQQAENLPDGCLAECVDTLASGIGLVLPADFGKTYGQDRVGNDLRLGLAWSPAADSKTVVRAGWGIYTGSFTAIAVSESRNSFSDYLPLNLAAVPLTGPARNFLYNPANPYRQQVLGRAAITVPGSVNVLAPFVVVTPFNPPQTYDKLSHLFESFPDARVILGLTQPAPYLKHSYSLQQSLSVEHELGNGNLVSIAYVGTFGRKLPRVTTPSGGFGHTRLLPRSFAPQAGPFPALDATLDSPARALIAGAFSTAKQLFENTANSRYQALQAELRRHYGQRLEFGAAFTWSHAIDTTSDFFDTAGEFALPQNSTVNSEAGSSAFDTRVRGAVHFTYDIPAWRNRFALKNWRLAGIFTAQSGQPYTINSAIDVNRDGNLTDRPNTTAGLLFDRPLPNVLVRLAEGTSPATLLAPAGQNGAVGRNSFTSGRLSNFDVAVIRDFRITERQTVTVRAEAFNLFNQSSFGIPERILESPGFGKSFYSLTPPRSVRFALKYAF